MKIKELKEILNHTDRHDDDELSIRLSMPSMGPVAMSNVKNVTFGFDWEKGHVLIHPEKRLSEKTKEEDVYHMASDLLVFLATEPLKRPRYEHRESRKILLRAGYTEEQINKFRHLFHAETK